MPTYTGPITAVRWLTPSDWADDDLLRCEVCGAPCSHGLASVAVQTGGDWHGRCAEHRPRDWEPETDATGAEVWAPFSALTDSIEAWIRRAPQTRAVAGTYRDGAWRVSVVDAASPVSHSAVGATIEAAVQALEDQMVPVMSAVRRAEREQAARDWHDRRDRRAGRVIS